MALDNSCSSPTPATRESLLHFKSRSVELCNSRDVIFRDNIDVRILNIDGNRNGRLHIGYNHTLETINGRLPIDLAVYRGGHSTMHGELKVIGVTVYVEGWYMLVAIVLFNMHNALTVVFTICMNPFLQVCWQTYRT